MADNLLKSKEIDPTPQGSQTTTIIQKIIEICKDGNTATRTGAELGRIKSHSNSVFIYKGDPATYVSEAEGVFTFAVTDISGSSPVLHTYTVDANKIITQGQDIEFGGGSASGGIEYIDYTTPDFQSWTTEADYSDIISAYESGKIVKARIDATTLFGGVMIADLVFIASDKVEFTRVDVSDGLRCFTISHSSANAITVSERTVS